MAIFFPPVPPVFTGGAQPYSPSKLPPQITAVRVDEPPYQHPGRTPQQIAISSWAAFPPNVPNPWPFTFMSGQQPLDWRKLSPGVPGQSVDNPPFAHRTRTAAQIAIASWSAIPPNAPDPWAYTFFAGRQPLMPGKLAPSIAAVPVDNPPFSHPSRTAQQIAVASWSAFAPNVPDPWPFTFMGGRQPLERIHLVIGALGDNPPFGRRRDIMNAMAIDAHWRELEKRNPTFRAPTIVRGRFLKVFVCVIH